MFKQVFKSEATLFARVWRRPAGGKVERYAFRFLLLTLAALVVSAFLPGGLETLFRVFAWIFGLICLFFAFWLAVRWVLNRILWTVRSRLIVTCLLMGLAPVVLFGMLAAIAGYLFCGQFATSVALEAVKDSAASMQERSDEVLSQLGRQGGKTAATEPAIAELQESRGGVMVRWWRDGKLGDAADPKQAKWDAFGDTTPRAWLHPGFHGLVGTSGKLFQCGASGSASGGHTLLVLTCSPFGDEELAAIAEGLGTLRIMPDKTDETMPPAPANPSEVKPVSSKPAPALPTKPKVSAEDATDDESEGLNADGKQVDGDDIDLKVGGKRVAGHHWSKFWFEGGKLAPAVSFLDVQVYFSAPLPSVVWSTGEDLETFVSVVSRPSLLYKRLFESSVSAGRIVYISLIATAIVFGVLELLAFGMAILVSRTITRSIADMYEATQDVDRGNLDHLIPVRRKDQLSALAVSFNKMTASLKELLIQQREKDRIQNELKIAQEVQNNLFPHTAIELPNFEVYGVCEPARTIGGDYYDFIPFGGTQLYLSLGDISGKGISAALLMASLHSAVRAYRAGESGESGENDPGFETSMSPGKLLALLNKHLYSSTQSAKYATLFLASYDNVTRRLTYSNGGHPPPVLLRADGSVKRLECGGSVVGLLDGMEYDEETVQLGVGDLLIAYSDGLSEPERNEEEFGEQRLIDVVRRNRILALPEIARYTMGAVREWIGDEEQPDDMTVVLARLG
jgi:sigma-B regulation protein RsbU (phosphoserine phosphatase)